MISEHSIHGINCLQSCRMEQRCCSGWELLSVLLLPECFVTPLLSMFLIPYQIWSTLETIVTVLEGFICDCCHSNGSFACSTRYCECAIVVYLHILECSIWLNTLISGCFLMCENQTFSPPDEEVRRRGYISLGYLSVLSMHCGTTLLILSWETVFHRNWAKWKQRQQRQQQRPQQDDEARQVALVVFLFTIV